MSERVSKWETHQERWGMRERTGGSVSEWTGKRANKRISKKWVGDRGAICQCKWPGNRCAKSNKNQVFERFVFSTTGWKVNHLSNSAKAISPIIGKRFMVYDITMSPNAIDSRYCLVWFICCLPQLPCFPFSNIFQLFSFCIIVAIPDFVYIYVYNRMIIDLLSKLVEQPKTNSRFVKSLVFAHAWEFWIKWFRVCK